MNPSSVPVPLWVWIGFLLFVVVILGIDLGVAHRKARKLSLWEAGLWSAIWVSLAVGFAAGIALTMGLPKALEFVTGYVIEWSLSVDNLFVFLVIFSYFGVPPALQHRVLFYGILGAILMRGAFIAGGLALLGLFHWVTYLFGAFLLFTGIRIAVQKKGEIHPERNPVLRLARRFLPLTRDYEGKQFFLRREGRLMATPLLMVLLAVESADVVFAVDSIPAILAITRDPFIVYTSNVFAIVGLRALFFFLAAVLDYFGYLKYGLAAVLVFVGVKMVLAEIYRLPILVSLAVVLGLLATSMLISYVVIRRAARFSHEAPSVSLDLGGEREDPP